MAKKIGKPSIWWMILSIIEPIVGLILFCVWRESKPPRASYCGKGAIIGAFITAFILLIFVIAFITGAVTLNSFRVIY